MKHCYTTRRRQGVQLILPDKYFVVLSALLLFALVLQSGELPLRSVSLDQERPITTLDGLLTIASSGDSALAVSFYCRRTTNPLDDPAFQKLLRDAKLEGQLTNVAMTKYYVAVRAGEDYSYLQSVSPIPELSEKWAMPVRLGEITNGVILTATTTQEERHGVEAARYEHSARQTGIDANEGFAVVRLVLGLDLANLDSAIKKDKASSGYTLGKSAGERLVLSVVEKDGAVRSLAVVSADCRFELLSQDESGAPVAKSRSEFLYRISCGGRIVSEYLVGGIVLLKNAPLIKAGLRKQLMPYPETYVVMANGGTNLVAFSKDFKPGNLTASKPLEPPVEPSRPNVFAVRLVLFVMICGGILVLAAICVRKLKPKAK